MPRTPSPALLRILATGTTTVVLLVMTALPALAASGTKTDPASNPYLIGSIGELLTTFIVGVVVSIIAWVLMPASDAAGVEEDHH